MPPTSDPRLRLLLWAPVLLLTMVTAAHAADPATQAPGPGVPVDASLEPLRPWLRHEDWTVRSIAAFELRRRTEAGAVHLATQMLAPETHPYAAAGALGALRGRPRSELVMEGGPALVVALLRWTRAEHPTVAAYAREVLVRLPPVRLGEDLARLEGWWKRGQDAYVREQQALLDERARGGASAAAPPAGPGSTSTAPGSPEKDDRFYGRLEQMRRDGLELAIVMDHTGSMGSVIGAAKVGAQRLIERLRAYVPRFRAGLVTYDDMARVRCVLTDNGEALQKAFSKVAASGGADLEEGVDKGLRLALAEGRLGWSQRAYRVVVVVGDAPPHEDDVPGMLRFLQTARQDVLYEQPVVVHTVSTDDLPVLHFHQIAIAGGGQHVTLRQTGRLVEELVLLTFAGADRERITAWMEEIDKLRAAAPKPGRR